MMPSHPSPPPHSLSVWLPDTYNGSEPYRKRHSQCYLCFLPVLCSVHHHLSIYPDIENKEKIENTPFEILFLHSSTFQLTKIHIYANMLHLFPPQPRMGDRSQARINDIALAVMFAAFH